MIKHSLSRRNVLTILSALPVVSGIPASSNTATAQTATSAEPLPSWSDGATKQSILDFVAAVTREGSPDFIPPTERIATFDNDGTLWVEHPMYTQLVFALDRGRRWRRNDPSGRIPNPTRPPLKAT